MILDLFKDVDTNNIDKLVKSYKNLNIEQTVAEMRTNKVADAEIRATLASQNYAKADIERVMTLKNSNTAKTQDIALTKLQTVGYKALSVASKAANIALGAISGVIISLIATKLISWLDDVIHRQEKLAEEVGISPQYLSRIENGNYPKSVSLSTLMRIAEKLNVTISTLTENI